VAITYGQNELYCSASPTGYRLPCPNPPNAIAAAVDIINFHLKPGNETGNNCPSPIPCTPESAMQMYVSNIKAILQPAELAKPLWNGEASYSKSGFINAYADTDMKVSFMPRYYLINWSLGISSLHWYTWESITPVAVQTSYQQTYNWLYGSTLSTPCAAAGTVWSCGITKSGTQYLIMWDTAQTCSSGSCTPGRPSRNWNVVYSNLTGPATMAHFHGPAPVGKNAGVAIPIAATELPSPIKGHATLTDPQEKDLLAGEWYVNVHTAKNPGGEIRGQVEATK